MASPQRSESPPPAKKRCKSPEFDFVSAPKVSKNLSEFGPQTSAGPRKSLSSDSQQSWFLPSSEVSAHSADEPEGIDSGFSDSATPIGFSEDSQDARMASSSMMTAQDEDAILEDAADLNLPKEDEEQPMPNQATNQEQDDEEDRLSDISGLSDLSGSDWKPTAGPFSWVQRQMSSGADPRELLKDMLSCDAVIPENLGQLTLWKIILNMICEPPRRKKLGHVNTLRDVVDLIKTSRKIIVLTGAGVSVSCGIPDFRSRDGVYARLAVDFPDLPDPQAMFDIHYFRKDPRPFFKFAREIYPGQFEPSPCHKFIRCVEKQGKLLRNYTQNIDTLEQVVGIENVVQCHGSFATASCMVCKHKVQAEVIRQDIFEQKIPYCSLPQCSSSITNPLPGPSSNEGGPSCSSTLEPQPQPSIMKPDIVFFGEGLGDEFHNAVAKDKNEVDLLIMIGSSLKVRPVALIPSSIDPSIPQILINREPLPHLTPDVELLGDCDGIVNQICSMLGEGWEDPVHRETLHESVDAVPKEEKLKEAEKPVENSPEEKSSTETEEKNENVPLPTSSPSNEELAKMWQPKTRQSIAQRLKPNEYFYVEPNRYVFPGAEVYDNDDESDISSRNSDSGSDTDSDDEAENSDAAAASPPTEDKTKSTEENIPTAPPLIQENQTLENQPENIQTSN